MMVYREGILNWPQQDWFLGAPADPEAAADFNLVRTVRLPALDPSNVLAAIRVCVTRHEALRTIVQLSRGEPGTQQVLAAPRLDGDIEGIVDIVPSQVFADTLFRKSRAYFDVSREWPIRVVISTRAGCAEWVGLVVDHSAADAWGMRVLCEEVLFLASNCDGTSTDAFARRSSPLQPIDLASWERSGPGATHLRRARKFWKAQLTTLADEVRESALVSTVEPPTGRAAQFRRCAIKSERLLRSAQTVSHRLEVPVSTVLLSAFGTALCTDLSRPLIGVQIECLNRMTKPAMQAVAKMNMRAVVIVHGTDWDGTRRSLARPHIHDLFRQQISAQRWAHADPFDVRELSAGVFPRIPGPGRSTIPSYMSLDVAGSVFNYMEDAWFPLDEELRNAADDRICLSSRIDRRGARKRVWAVRSPDRLTVGVDWQEGILDADSAEALLAGVVDSVSRMEAGTDRLG